jgi:hypothetical protein
MRKLVTIILKSLPELANTFLILGFFFLIFGILGIQTNQGMLYQRCRLTEKPVNDTYWAIDPT